MVAGGGGGGSSWMERRWECQLYQSGKVVAYDAIMMVVDR
jgi:hypothetical protein